MLFHDVFEQNATHPLKYMSELDDLAHDFVYRLHLSLVLKALSWFPCCFEIL